MYFLVKLFVDKYQICNQYSRPLLQYSRRARTTTIVILMSQLMAQYFNSFYFLVLAPEGMQGVGLLCLLSALGFTILSALYIYQPESLRVLKSAVQANSGAMDNGATEGKNQDLIRNIYNPPDPDSLQVGEHSDTNLVSPGSLSTDDDGNVQARVPKQEAHNHMTNPLATPPAALGPAALHLDADQARSQRFNVLQDHSIHSPAGSSIWMAEQPRRQVTAQPPGHNPFNARVGGR